MILVKTHSTCILYTEHQSQVSAPGPVDLLFKFYLEYFSAMSFLHYLSYQLKTSNTDRVHCGEVQCTRTITATRIVCVFALR